MALTTEKQQQVDQAIQRMFSKLEPLPPEKKKAALQLIGKKLEQMQQHLETKQAQK